MNFGEVNGYKDSIFKFNISKGDKFKFMDDIILYELCLIYVNNINQNEINIIYKDSITGQRYEKIITYDTKFIKFN